MNEKYKQNDKNKEEVQLKRKPLVKNERKPTFKNQNRHLKFLGKKPEAQFTAEIKLSKHRIKENESILQANVSLIEGSSFISNKQDHSLDSMDKMIIGVTGADEKESVADDSKDSATLDIDFTAIHKEYEFLIGKNRLLGEQFEYQDEQQSQQEENAENISRVLPEYEEQWQQKDEQKPIFCLSPTKKNKELKKRVAKIESKMQEIKNSSFRKYQDISTSSIKNLNMGNLSAIHEEKEQQNHENGNKNKNIHEEDEEDLIDFVSHPDPENNKKLKNHHENNLFIEENMGEQQEEVWDDESPMLDNLQLDLLEKGKNDEEKNRNYQHLLEELESKEEQLDGTEKSNLHQTVEGILATREKWIRSTKNKSQKWKNKQIQMLRKFKEIMKNPFFDSENSGDSVDNL